MAKDPEIGYQVLAEVVSVEGSCSAGHAVGDKFEISCHDTGGLCGYFYHDIFPSLSTFQFGGSYPWWQGDAIELRCPDYRNFVTLSLKRIARPYL